MRIGIMVRRRCGWRHGGHRRGRRGRRCRGRDIGASTFGPMDMDPNLGKLCELCNSLYFNIIGFHRLPYYKLFELLPQREYGKRIFRQPFYNPSIGNVIQNAMEHGCVICGKVVEYLKHCDDFDASCVGDSSASYFIDVLNQEVDSLKRVNLVRFMVRICIKTGKDDEVVSRPLIQFQKCSDPPLQHLDWDGGEEQPYNGRIRPPKVDAQLFRKWIDTCCGSHGDMCNSFVHIMTPPKWLRLLDVKERCLVVQNPGWEVECYRFVALSYVWGKHKLDENVTMPELTKGEWNSLQEPKSLTREKVLATIDDAMTLVAQLGEQYLWVDCLCIMQDDKDDQEDFINAMDSIYGCALLTIVAASGDNANAGLPGIHSDRSKQEVIKVKNGISLLQTLDPKGKHLDFDTYKYIGGSTWNTRGWTFQEKIFSRRTLIFTKEQVYWECQGATWCEDSFWETKKSPFLYRQCFDAKEFRLPWNNENGYEFHRRYEKLVNVHIMQYVKFLIKELLE